MQGHYHAQAQHRHVIQGRVEGMQNPGDNGRQYDTSGLGGTNADTNTGYSTPTVTAPTTDTTNGTPRTGTETNPANLGLTYIIKY